MSGGTCVFAAMRVSRACCGGSPVLPVLCADRRLRLDVYLLAAGLTAAEPPPVHNELPIWTSC